MGGCDRRSRRLTKQHGPRRGNLRRGLLPSGVRPCPIKSLPRRLPRRLLLPRPLRWRSRKRSNRPMIESLWTCLLVMACHHRQTRPLAILLACKAVVNYAAAFAGFWTLPALFDVLFGTVGVVLVLRLPHPRIGAVMVACFVVAPLAHAWHWGLWSQGVYVGVQYYWVMLGLFSAQVFALAWPEAQDFVRTCRNNLRLARRRSVAGLGSHGRGEGSASRRG